MRIGRAARATQSYSTLLRASLSFFSRLCPYLTVMSRRFSHVHVLHNARCRVVSRATCIEARALELQPGGSAHLIPTMTFPTLSMSYHVKSAIQYPSSLYHTLSQRMNCLSHRYRGYSVALCSRLSILLPSSHQTRTCKIG